MAGNYGFFGVLVKSPSFWEDQTMQTYIMLYIFGNFEAFPHNNALLRVSNIMTPAFW